MIVPYFVLIGCPLNGLVRGDSVSTNLITLPLFGPTVNVPAGTLVTVGLTEASDTVKDCGVVVARTAVAVTVPTPWLQEMLAEGWSAGELLEFWSVELTVGGALTPS